MAKSRANETPEQASVRRDRMRCSMQRLRENQSQEVSARQNLNARFRMASLRGNEDTNSVMVTQSHLRMQHNRSGVLSIPEAMLVFHTKIKEGPDFVCTVCH